MHFKDVISLSFVIASHKKSTIVCIILLTFNMLLISLSASTVFILCFSAIFPYCSWCCIWCVVGKLELSSSEEYWFSFKQMANLAGLTLLWLLRLPLSILQQFLASWPHISYSRVSEGCGQSQSGDFVGSVFGGSFSLGSPCPPHTSRYCSTYYTSSSHSSSQ